MSDSDSGHRSERSREKEKVSPSTPKRKAVKLEDRHEGSAGSVGSQQRRYEFHNKKLEERSSLREEEEKGRRKVNKDLSSVIIDLITPEEEEIPRDPTIKVEHEPPEFAFEAGPRA